MTGWFWVLAVVVLLGAGTAWEWMRREALAAAGDPGIPFRGPHPADPARTRRARRAASRAGAKPAPRAPKCCTADCRITAA